MKEESKILPPSYLDRVIVAVESSKYSSSIIYSILFIIILLVNHALAWTDGSVTKGVVNFELVINSIWPVFALVLLHHLDSLAVQSSKRFRPAANVDDATYEAYIHDLTTMPARPVLFLSLMALLISAYLTVVGSESLSILRQDVFLTLSVFIRLAIGFSFFPILVYHTIRQLLLVSRFHRLATEIDLFNLEPLYAFSQLTSRTGVGWILLFSINLLLTAFGEGTGFIPTGVLWWIIFLVEIILAAAAFILPLIGMHNLMVEGKAKLVSATDQRLKTLFGLLHKQVDKGGANRIKDLKDTLSSVVIESEVIEKIPTWPWRMQTLRGFISAILIPILLLVMQQFLERMIQN